MMDKLPIQERRLLYAVYAAGALSLLLSVGRGALQAADFDIADLLLFLGLGILAGSKKIVLLRVGKKQDACSMSLGFAIIFATLIRFGTEVAVLVGLACTLASCVYPRRFPWYQTLFNVSVNVCQTACAGAVYYALNPGHGLVIRLDSFPAITASTLTFFLINTGLVASIIGIELGRSPLAVWQENFLWTAPSYLIGAVISSIVVPLLGPHILAGVLCAGVVAYFTHTSYRSYMDRANALVENKERLAELYLATIKSLALAIDAKDQYTHQHILRVQQYAVAIAKRLGITGDDLVGLETAALLHDIGKLGVPEYVLLKPGPLTDEEFAKIKEHPRIGADILDPVEFPWPVLPGVKYHHERWDGTGYPEGLKGEDIPLQGRILAVADVYDALTSTRSYRSAWSHEKAVAEIRSNAGRHFEPRIVEAFLEVIEGVVDEMATHGLGPKAEPQGNRELPDDATDLIVPVAVVPQQTRSQVAARDIHRAASELWALYEVAQTLSSSLGLDETLDILARRIFAILPDTTCLFLLHADDRVPTAPAACPGKVLQVRAAVGAYQEGFHQAHTAGSHSLSLQVAQSKKIYAGKFDPADLLSGGDAATPPPFAVALILPIIYENEVLGTINLYQTRSSAFTPHDQHLLEMIVERAAMAIYNGLLFERTRSHALTDPLTSLANIRCLSERLEVSCADTARKPFALLCLDLDSFKPINDNFGHQQGDRVLRDLGEVFRSCVRPTDTVARYGGDEFLILVEGMEMTQAHTFALRLREAISGYDTGLAHNRMGPVRLGVSIGVACFPFDAEDTTALMSIADRRMYHDKAERKLLHLTQTSIPVPITATRRILTERTRRRRPLRRRSSPQHHRAGALN